MALTKNEIEYLLQTKKRSILHPFKNDILKLKEEGVTFVAIKIWLKKRYEIETSCENIRQFYLRNYENSTLKIEEKNTKSNKKKLFANLEG